MHGGHVIIRGKRVERMQATFFTLAESSRALIYHQKLILFIAIEHVQSISPAAGSWPCFIRGH